MTTKCRNDASKRPLDAAKSAGLEPEFLHLGATTGALRSPATRHSLVRLGIAAYGFCADPAVELDAGRWSWRHPSCR